MRIVITGALGHIGSKLIRSLANTFPGSKIVMLDNFLVQRYCSLFQLPTEGNYEFYEVDVANDSIEKFIQKGDHVVHLAAITDAASSFENQTEVENVNYTATKKIADICLKKEARLIFLSTTSVYGTQKEQVSEDCEEKDLNPQSPYAKAKLDSENFLKQEAENGLKHVALRFGTIFGTSPGMRFHTAINKFCWQASMGLPITVWKTALDQYRPYLDLEDAVRAIEFVISESLYDGQVYNVLTLNATVKQITELIQEQKADLEIKLVDSKIMNQLSYFVLPEKFMAKGFSYRGDLKREISKTVGQFNSVSNDKELNPS